MKNSFCRICRGRFNLKYPPTAVDSENKKPSSRTIAVRIDESGEISDNICWDCEDTLLGFHKSVGEDNDDEEEPVVVDDDEILYKSLEKTICIHRLSKEVEIIEIESSDSEHEERVTVPKRDDIVRVESASTVVGRSRKDSGDALVGNKIVAVKKNTPNAMSSDARPQKDTFTRGKIFESMRCPLCPYLSGIEYEVVLHIRRNHPHYTGDHLRFEHKEGDSSLTRRIIFVHLWTFFECKACGKIHDRFWPHRKHLAAHDRKHLKNVIDDHITLNNNEVFISHDPMNKVQTPKRALDSLEDIRDCKNPKTEERLLRRTSKDNNSVEVNETLAVNIHKSFQNSAKKPQCHSVSKKSKSKGLLRKQQLLQAKREKRLQKRDKKSQPKSKPTQVIPKPTFKMPQQPAPRASSVVKQILHHPRFSCKLCSQTLNSFICWNMHMIRVHSTTEFPINPKVTSSNVCKKCDKRFASVSNLRMHVRLSHRRKNRHVEINGNDNEEVCRQTLTPKKESKEEQPPESLPLLNGISTTSKPRVTTLTSALLCQYCGTLFTASSTMKMHESCHDANADVRRIFKIKPHKA